MTSIKVKVVRRPQIKVKTLVRFPANVVTQNFLTVTNSGGTYTFSVDYSVLTAGPVTDPTTAFVAVQDQTSGIYRTVTLASLLTSGLDADLQAIAALSGTGILVRTASNTWVLRTNTAPAAGLTITNPDGVSGNIVFALANDLAAVEGLAANGMAARTATDTWTVRTNTGTAAEITVNNGDGVAGNPTYSLPSALTFTGKTITGGTYASAVTFNKVTITAPATAATLTLIDGTTLTGPAASGTVMTLGNTETVTGVKTFGSAGAVGRLKVAGTTSGSTVLDATAAASGTLTLPAATDTLIGKATTDILTNKTYDTAGAGNSFSINSLAATANTGTGAVVRATSPTLVTPALGTPTALVLTSATGLPLSGLTTQAAFTFVGNNTSGTAVPTAVDIHALTAKASPAATDEVIISDQAASGAWKRVTVSSLASAGSVASFNTLTGAVTFFPVGAQNYLITESHAANAATFAIKTLAGIDATASTPVFVNTSDGTTAVITAALSVTIPSTGTMGAGNAVPFRLWFVLINDAGTIRIGVRNCSDASNIYSFSGDGILSSTIITTPNSAGVTYTGTAVTSKQFVIAGFADYDSGLATAGTWVVSPTRIQLFGPYIKKPGDSINTYNVTASNNLSTTSATPATIGTSKAVTPSSLYSLFKIDAGVRLQSSQQGVGAQTSIYRDATPIGSSGRCFQNIGANGMDISTGLTAIDKPLTTSSVTYAIFGWANAVGTAVNIGNTAPQSITITELMG